MDPALKTTSRRGPVSLETLSEEGSVCGIPVLASDALYCPFCQHHVHLAFYRGGATYSACTLEFLTSRSHIHTRPLTPMVLSMIAMAGIPLCRQSVQESGPQESRRHYLQLDNLAVW